MASRTRSSAEEKGLLDSEEIKLVEDSPQVGRDDNSTTIVMDGTKPPLLRHQHGSNSPAYRRGPHVGYRSRFASNQRGALDDDEKKPRRSFCRSWCEMWFLLAQSKFTCVGLSVVLFGGGLLLVLLSALGGLKECHTLQGAVIFCQLMGGLSIALGFLCCSYHWVKDDDDLPFAIFCVAYCLLLLFIFVTIAGTVVVFTRIHPIGPDQPPPGVSLPHPHEKDPYRNATGIGAKECGLIELPLGILVICYFLAIGFACMSYFACILALGATSDIPPL